MWTGAFSILCIAIRLIVAAEDDQSEEFSYLNITCEQKLLVREVEIREPLRSFFNCGFVKRLFEDISTSRKSSDSAENSLDF